VSNYCCSPTSNFNIRARSFAKSNSHTCKFVRASFPSKRPSKASKYSPKGVERTTLLHTLLALEAGGDNLAWAVDAYGILGIHCLQASRKASLHFETSKHLPQHFMRHNIEHFFDVHKSTIEWLFFCLTLFYQSPQYEKLVSSVLIFAKPSLTLGVQPTLFNPFAQPFVKNHSKQLC
jgi:hypothetical protein